MIVLHDLKLAPPDAVFFSGTFLPWHQGHQECVEQALLHKLHLVVCPDQSPWKDFQISNAADLEEKLAAYEVWFYPGFLKLTERNPTIDWIKNLSWDQRSLLMGDDSFLSLDKWQSANELIGLLRRIYVVPRQGEKMALLQQQKQLLSMNSKLEIIFLAHHSYEHVSSTLLRK